MVVINTLSLLAQGWRLRFKWNEKRRGLYWTKRRRVALPGTYRSLYEAEQKVRDLIKKYGDQPPDHDSL